MNLNLFENLNHEIKSKVNIKGFLEELSNFINDVSSNIKKEDNSNTLDDNCRKEGHLYLVTEDRNDSVYLWDYTDKSKKEFEESNLPKDLLNIAKEGTMLQYKNGKFELYSENGYDML